MNATRVVELADAIAERAGNLGEESDDPSDKAMKQQVHELRRFVRRLEVELEPAEDDTLGEAC